MKKVLFAYDLVNDDNEYILRLVNIFSTISNIKIVCSLNEFWSSQEYYDLVIINWPDYLFGWKTNLSSVELELLEKRLDYLKSRKTKIFTVLHDEFAHHSRSIERDKLFEITYKSSNYLGHLGNYSKKKYQKLYNDLNIRNILLYHPQYTNFDFFLSQDESKKKIKIEEKSKLFFVPGKVRNIEEFNLIIKTFKNINCKNKILIFQRIGFKISLKKYSFKNILRKLNTIYLLHRYNIYLAPNKYISTQELSVYFSACDYVFLPRFNILNSGNIVLANQFGKKILGFKTGNITEWLEYTNDTILEIDKIRRITLKPQLNYKEKKKSYIERTSDDIIRNQFINLLKEL